MAYGFERSPVLVYKGLNPEKALHNRKGDAMKSPGRIKLLATTLALGITAVALLVGGLSAAADDGYVDLTLEMEAPTHVAADSTYVVRIAYYNLGTNVPSDAWVTATVPEGTKVIDTADRWDEPLPPDTTAGRVLSWHFDNLTCHKPLDACCGHVLITLQTDKDLPDNIALTTMASVATSGEESDLTNNEDSIVSLTGAMAASQKQVQARLAMPLDVLTYTITLDYAHQPSGGTFQNAVLTDTMPFSHQVRFLGWSSAVTGTMIDSHQFRWQGQVQAGEPLTLQYRLGVEGAITPGTVLTNVAVLGWNDQTMVLGPVTTVVTLPHGAVVLGPGEGGSLHHRYGVTLTVPADTIPEMARFQIRPLFTDTLPSGPPGGLLFAHRAFELTALRFGESMAPFGRPLTFTVHYTETRIDGLKRETLRLWTRSGPDEPWAVFGEPTYVASGTMLFTTTHFSQFALFGEGKYKDYLPLILR
jgi:hypothetical protein